MQAEKPRQPTGKPDLIPKIPGRLYVGNLPIDISSMDIQNRFGNFPGFEINGIHPIHNQATGEFKGMVYIDYNLAKHGRVTSSMIAPGRQAEHAKDPLAKFLRTYNGLIWRGKKLRVEEARVDIFKRLEAERNEIDLTPSISKIKQRDPSKIKEVITSRVEKDLRLLQVRHKNDSTENDTVYRVRRKTYERFTRAYPQPLPITVETERKEAERLGGMTLNRRLRQKQNTRPFGWHLSLTSSKDHINHDATSRVNWSILPYTPRGLQEFRTTTRNLHWCIQQYHHGLLDYSNQNSDISMELYGPDDSSLPTEFNRQHRSGSLDTVDMGLSYENRGDDDGFDQDQASLANTTIRDCIETPSSGHDQAESAPDSPTLAFSNQDNNGQSIDHLPDQEPVREENPLSWLFSDPLADFSDDSEADAIDVKHLVVEEEPKVVSGNVFPLYDSDSACAGRSDDDDASAGNSDSILGEGNCSLHETHQEMVEMETEDSSDLSSTDESDSPSLSASNSSIESEPLEQASSDYSTDDSEFCTLMSEAKSSSESSSSSSSSKSSDSSAATPNNRTTAKSNSPQGNGSSNISYANGDSRRSLKRRRDDDEDDDERKKLHKHKGHYNPATDASSSTNLTKESEEVELRQFKDEKNESSSDKAVCNEGLEPDNTDKNSSRKLSKHERKLLRRNAKKGTESTDSGAVERNSHIACGENARSECTDERARQLQLLDSLKIGDKSLMQELMDEDDERVPIWQKHGITEHKMKGEKDETEKGGEDETSVMDGLVKEDESSEPDRAPNSKESKELSQKQKRKLRKKLKEELERQKWNAMDVSGSEKHSVEPKVSEKLQKSTFTDPNLESSEQKSKRKAEKKKKQKDSDDSFESTRPATTSDASDVFKMNASWREFLYGDELAKAGRSQIPIQLTEEGKPILLPAKEAEKNKATTEKKITLARPESKPLEPFFGYVPAHKDSTFSTEVITKQVPFSFSFFTPSEEGQKDSNASHEEADKSTASIDATNNPFQVASSFSNPSEKSLKEKKLMKRPKSSPKQSNAPSQLIASAAPANPNLFRSVASSFGAFAGAALPTQTSNLKDDFRLKMKMMKNSNVDLQKRKFRK